MEKKSETERRRSRKTKRKRKTNANAKTLVLGSDSYSSVYSYSDHEAETCRRELDYRYHQDLRMSDGFDVDMYKIPIPEQITPCDLDIYSNVAIKFGKFAVDDYNQKQPEGGIKLAFVKPLKCNIRHSRGIIYYITFEAKDVDAPPDDQSLTYQTQVFYGFKTEPQVLIFRPKLTDNSEITTTRKKKAKTQSNCVQDFESYYRELEPREGYDISPGIHDCMIKPMKLNAENTQLATKLGQCALESYYRQKKNKQIWGEEKGPVVKLKFVQPLKMNSENMKDGSIRYYLTFLAKVVGVPDDQSPITYQTQVSVYDGVVRVARFRPKLTANSNSSE